VSRGQLIAVEGVHGGEVHDAATTLVERLADRSVSAGISRWDASGLFTDVASAPALDRDVSPRTLLLLYAADLAFRLRWEIGPALEEGAVVIAAPYVHTAIAFAVATGLSRDWIAAVLRFAPPATRTIALKDRKSAPAWKRRPDRGFGECCATLLDTRPKGFARRKTRKAMVRELEGDRRRKDLVDIVDEILAAAGTKNRERRTKNGTKNRERRT
jgi:thymidylate kinase